MMHADKRSTTGDQRGALVIDSFGTIIPPTDRTGGRSEDPLSVVIQIYDKALSIMNHPVDI